MTERRQKYTAEFKRDGVKLVTEQGYTIAEAARNLGLNGNILGCWKRQLATDGEVAFPGKGFYLTTTQHSTMFFLHPTPCLSPTTDH